MSPTVDTKFPQGHVSDSKATRIHDDVVSWVKSVQIWVGKAGDQILEDLRCKSQAGVQGTKFIGNEEFLRTITPDKIGFLQEQENEFSIEDYSLDLATPVTNLTPNAEVKCKIVSKKPVVEFPPLKVSVLKSGKVVCQIPQSDLPLFSVPVPEVGDYEVHAQMQGKHVQGSPLSLPVSSDTAIRDRLAMLGLAPLNSKEFGIGTKCFAKWSEDGCWYNAVVEKIVDGKYRVKFTDYGNDDQLEQKDLRLSAKDIPPTEELDEHIPISENEVMKDNSSKVAEVVLVPENQETFAIGENVLTKWSEDETWYNAKVLTVAGPKIGVNFVDYGNDAEESIERVLKPGSQIPAGDLIDELVKETAATPEKALEPEVVQPSISKPQEQDSDPSSTVETPSNESPASSGLFLRVDDMVIGKWAEDNIWYNAKVLKVDKESSSVLFVDYGNEEEVKLCHLVRTESEIPGGEAIDEHVNTSAKPDLEKEVTQSLNPSTGHVAEVTPRDIDENVEITTVKSPDAEVESRVSVPLPEDKEVKEIEDLSSSEAVNIGACFKVGDMVFAKWAEDMVWYNAKIEVAQPDSYQVLFVDYGNSEQVTKKDVVATSSEIPTNEDYDEHISIPSKETTSGPIKEATKLVDTDAGIKVGDLLFAKWSEDEVWYNAKVLNIHSDHIEVEFVDYGNSDKVTLPNVVKDVKDIPKEDDVDENVKGIDTDGAQEKEEPNKVDQANIPPIEAKSPPKENVSAKTKDLPNVATHVVGDFLFAKWSEDGVWYNAKILKTHRDHLEVEFVDYGNSDKVTLPNVVKDVKDIPKGDDVDENVKVIDTDGAQEKEDSKKVEQANIPPIEAKSPRKENVSAKTKDLPNVGDHVVGDLLFAKWSEDGVWYNAKILHVHSDHLEVEFVDYGNTDKVTLPNVVKNAKDIPAADDVDQNIEGIAVEVRKKEDNLVPVESATLGTETIKDEKIAKNSDSISTQSKSKQSTELQVGSSCVARWSEDEIWYNAKILSVTASGFNVHFVNYGNDADVTEFYSHDDSYKIPSTDTVDENVTVSVQPPMSSSSTAETNSASPLAEEQGKKAAQDDSQKTNSKAEETTPSTEKKPIQDASQKTNSKGEKKVTSSPEKEPNVEIGEICFAKWGEDSVWYNCKVVEVSSSGSVTVEFIDYGNADIVTEIVKRAQDIPKDSQVDDHVLALMSSQTSESPSKDTDSQEDSGVGDSVLDQDKTSFLNFVDNAELGACLTARKRMVKKNLNGPTGVAVLDEDTIAVTSRNDNKVNLFSKTGNPLGELTVDGRGKLSRPSDICALKTGECLVRDGNGIHMWDNKKVYKGRLGEANYNKYFGCAENDDYLITINCNLGSEVGPGTSTEPGMTDVFFFDKKTLDIAYRCEMEDVIYKPLKVNSECSMVRYLNYDNGRLFVVDMGLHYIYCIEYKDGTWGGTLLGGNGKGMNQLNKPAGLVFDGHGNAMVVDSSNNRLQVLDTNLNFCGTVKVDRPLVRPSGIFFDKESSELYVSNFSDSSVVCYVLDKPEA